MHSPPGVALKFKAPFFSEFVIEVSAPAAKVLEALREENILGGIDLAQFFPQHRDCILVSVTEMNGVAELDKYAQALPKAIARAGASSPSTTSALAHKR